jgi:anti-sigma factor RsiW
VIANCQTTIELSAAYVDGALTEEEEQALRAHLADCPRCVEFLESYQGTSRIYRAATDVELPGDIEERLLAFLKRETGGG